VECLGDGRDVGDVGDVGDVALRVADGLDKDCLGALIDQRLEAGGVAVVGETGGDAELRQCVREQVVGAAVQRGAGDDVVARFRDGLDRVGQRGLARGQGERSNATFELGDALFQHVLRRIHDPRVDVARHLPVEQVGTVLPLSKA
jgi:hypothetical protein